MAKQLALLLAPLRPLFIEEPLLHGQINEASSMKFSLGLPTADFCSLSDRLHRAADRCPHRPRRAHLPQAGLQCVHAFSTKVSTAPLASLTCTLQDPTLRPAQLTLFSRTSAMLAASANASGLRRWPSATTCEQAYILLYSLTSSYTPCQWLRAALPERTHRACGQHAHRHLLPERQSTLCVCILLPPLISRPFHLTVCHPGDVVPDSLCV
jgi:hypothetical protein